MQEHMTETLKTFVGARLAVDKDRKETSDVTAEDDALVSLLSGAGISDPKGRAHFAQALREHLLASKTKQPISIGTDTAASNRPTVTAGDASSAATINGNNMQTDSNLQQESEPAKSGQSSVPAESQHAGHAHHGISSHGHRAFLIDENNQAAGSAAGKGPVSDSKQTA